MLYIYYRQVISICCIGAIKTCWVSAYKDSRVGLFFIWCYCTLLVFVVLEETGIGRHVALTYLRTSNVHYTHVSV